MFSRLVICLALGFALILSPGLDTQSQAKTSRKKATHCTIKTKVRKHKKISKTRHSKRYRRKHSRRVKKYKSRRAVRRYSASRPSFHYRGGICETPPLMKITPQRDGRFVLTPLTSPKPRKGLTNPISREPKQIKSGGDDYSYRQEKKTPIYPRWSFRELLLNMAKHYQGAPYSRGATLGNSGATDCSGFVQYIYQGFKIDLPRCSCDQAQVGKIVTKRLDFSRLLPGDLLFFRRGGRYIGHSGIYLGEGKMIHASNHRRGVTITNLRQSYYINTFVVAKRVFEVRHPH